MAEVASRPPPPNSRVTLLASEGLRLAEPRAGYRFGPENALLPTLLEGLVPEEGAEGREASRSRVVDLGAGCGVLGLIAGRRLGWEVHLVEREPTFAGLAAWNLEESGLRGRVVEADLRETAQSAPDAGSAALVLANPPFFNLHEGRVSAQPTTRHATHAHFGGLTAFLEAAVRWMTPTGAVLLLYPAEGLAEAFDSAAALDLRPEALCLVHARHKGRPYRAWVRLGRGERPLVVRRMSVVTAR